MSKRRMKIFFILGSVVAILALFMFSYVSFAGIAEKSTVDESVTVKDPPKAEKIGMTFNIAGTGNLVFSIYDDDKGEDVYWDITKEFVFNDFNEKFKNVDKVKVRHEFEMNDFDFQFELFEKGTSTYALSTRIYGDFGSEVTNIELKDGQEFTSSIKPTVTIQDGVKGSVNIYTMDSGRSFGEPAPNQHVLLYDQNGTVLRDFTTDEKGKKTISDLSKSDVTNTLFFLVGQNNYSDGMEICDPSDWKNSKRDIYLDTAEDCNVLLDVSPNIQSFKVSVNIKDPKEPEKYSFVVPRLHLTGLFNLNEGGIEMKLNISDKGTCVLTAISESITVGTIEVEPLYSTGYVLDYWEINGKQYTAGQEAPYDKDSKLVASPFAKLAGDDPVPTPVTPVGDVTYSAKTYDEIPIGVIVALIMIVTASAVVMVRKEQ